MRMYASLKFLWEPELLMAVTLLFRRQEPSYCALRFLPFINVVTWPHYMHVWSYWDGPAYEFGSHRYDAIVFKWFCFGKKMNALANLEIIKNFTIDKKHLKKNK